MGGNYFLIRAGEPWRNEWTTIGYLLYSSDGDLLACDVSVDRAIKRGDLPAEYAGKSADVRARYGSLSRREAVEKMQGSTAHAMSSMQVHRGGGTIWENDAQLEERKQWLLNRMVLGLAS